MNKSLLGSPRSSGVRNTHRRSLLSKTGVAVAFVAVSVLSTLAVTSFAQPQLGSLAEKLALTAAARRLNPYLEANQPVIRDWDTIFPHVDALPGPAFRSVGVPEAELSRSLAASGFRTISLPPGDYSIPLQLYCMHFSGGSGPGLTYLLGPFRGTRAEMISTLIGRGSAQHVPHQGLQVLAWGLQAGLPYERLDPGSRTLFDQLLPEYREALGPGFLEGIQQLWQTLARTIPGLPPFNVAVGKLGPASILLQDYQDSQRVMQQYAGDYQQLSQHLFLAEQGTNSGVRPWSVVGPGVYERMIGDRGAMEPGSLQVRVQPAASRARLRTDRRIVATAFLPGPDQTARDETVEVPVGNVMGYPNLKNGQTPLGGVATPNEARVLLTLGVYNMLAESLVKPASEVLNVTKNLMWLICAPQSLEATSAPDWVAYLASASGQSTLAQDAGTAANINDIVVAVMKYLGGDPVELLTAPATIVGLYELQQSGISCSNYNLIQGISAAAKTFQGANPNEGASSSTTIVPNSISISPDLITAQVAAPGLGTTNPVKIQLHFTVCGTSANCTWDPTNTIAPGAGQQRNQQVSAGSGPSTLTVVASPPRVVAGSTCAISGIARDGNGNPVSSATVQLTVSAGGVTIPISAMTGSDGSYSTTFSTPPVSGNVSITATVGSSSSSATAKTTITVVAGRP